MAALALGCASEIQDEVLDAGIVPVGGAHYLIGEPSAAVQDVSFRKLERAIAGRERTVRVAPYGIREVILQDEILKRLLILVDA